MLRKQARFRESLSALIQIFYGNRDKNWFCSEDVSLADSQIFFQHLDLLNNFHSHNYKFGSKLSMKHFVDLPQADGNTVRMTNKMC